MNTSRRAKRREARQRIKARQQESREADGKRQQAKRERIEKRRREIEHEFENASEFGRSALHRETSMQSTLRLAGTAAIVAFILEKNLRGSPFRSVQAEREAMGLLASSNNPNLGTARKQWRVALNIALQSGASWNQIEDEVSRTIKSTNDKLYGWVAVEWPKLDGLSDPIWD